MPGRDTFFSNQTGPREDKIKLLLAAVTVKEDGGGPLLRKVGFITSTNIKTKNLGLVSLGGTGRDDISIRFASRDFRPCWIYTWMAFKLPLVSPRRFFYPQKFLIRNV